MSGLVARALVVGRGTFRLHPLSIDIAAGETVALIGPNGGGKTTLLKTLAGLIPPIAGSVETEAAAAYLPPPGAVMAGFSALHLTALGRAGHRRWSSALAPADIEAARTALDGLGIADLGPRPFDRLSSGQQQLVLLARLTVQEAGVCLLDEPLAMLDPANATAVERAITALATSGRAVVVSTHGLALAARADRVIALTEGGAVIDTPSALLTRDRLADLYGVGFGTCPCCGQPTPQWKSRDPGSTRTSRG